MARVAAEARDAGIDGTTNELRGTTCAPFGAALEPVLREACGGRLSGINWFRTDWQRGGAVTGYATIRDDKGVERDAVVKLPVPPTERTWLRRLQDADGLAPRLYADGEALGGYDIAWVVMERLPHGPLSSAWDGAEAQLLVDAAVRFYDASSKVELEGDAPRRDWSAILKQARSAVRRDGFPHAQQWTKALKKTQKKLDKWLAAWDARPTDDWCHGDLHYANALTRDAPPNGPVVLIDFARVHRGHWVQDAVYFEHLFWARPKRLAGVRVCSAIAKGRKGYGLTVNEGWPKLASIRRALIAMSAPVTLMHDGDPAHLEASLAVLEREAG